MSICCRGIPVHNNYSFTNMPRSLSAFLHKLRHWEYWPSWIIYAPILPVLLYYMAKARSFFFFNAANPSIESGGFALESKKKIYDIIPTAFVPKTILADKNSSLEQLVDRLKFAGISFPLICKPDIGLRGLGVSKITDRNALEEYATLATVPFLLQEYIALKEEVGIFYCRLPNERTGKITGIVYKELPAVFGDGTSTIEQLIQQDPRLSMQLPAWKLSLGHLFSEVPPKGSMVELSPYGNHARGAKFLDYSHRITPAMTVSIDAICQQIPGFYFGRLDLRFNTWEELERGEKLCIIELNGSGSEPTHMYDPAHSLLTAWRIIIEHWEMLYRISAINHQNGEPYFTFQSGLKLLTGHRDHLRKLKELQVQL